MKGSSGKNPESAKAPRSPPRPQGLQTAKKTPKTPKVKETVKKNAGAPKGKQEKQSQPSASQVNGKKKTTQKQEASPASKGNDTSSQSGVNPKKRQNSANDKGERNSKESVKTKPVVIKSSERKAMQEGQKLKSKQDSWSDMVEKQEEEEASKKNLKKQEQKKKKKQQQEQEAEKKAQAEKKQESIEKKTQAEKKIPEKKAPPAKKPWDSFPFHSASTFLKAPVASSQERLDFAVAGVCYDGATTNRPGARLGPSAIRAASHSLCDGQHPLFGVSPLDFKFGDVGDLPLAYTSLTSMRQTLEPLCGELLKRHEHLVWLGGDHCVTLSLLRAYRKHYGQPLAVLHFDAHCDAWEDHFGEPSGHGTWVYEAFKEGLVRKDCFFQVGIRSSADGATRTFVSNNGGVVYTARHCRGLENASQLGPILYQIRSRLQERGDPPMYCSLDIDCLDPAYAPGTGTPEPGGLSTSQVLTFLEELVPALNFVGMDLMEVSPPYDHAEITSLAASHLVWTYLCGVASKKKK